MKTCVILLSLLLTAADTGAKENTYTGSTPAGRVIRLFLDIPQADSIDFIRWKLTLNETTYQLACRYGIGKPNTNGFINSGTTVELHGSCRKEKNEVRLQNGLKQLRMAELNADLLYLLDSAGSLLVGNAGWSYALNNVAPAGIYEINLAKAPTPQNDSMIFEGRTPCGIPHVVTPGTPCYKLKWRIIFYAGTQQNKSGRYKISGTPWRAEGGRSGSWKISTGKGNRTVYQLNDEAGNNFLYFLKLDDHILAFTDAQGKPFIGNEDFSYILNRKL